MRMCGVPRSIVAQQPRQRVRSGEDPALSPGRLLNPNSAMEADRPTLSTGKQCSTDIEWRRRWGLYVLSFTFFFSKT